MNQESTTVYFDFGLKEYRRGTPGRGIEEALSKVLTEVPSLDKANLVICRSLTSTPEAKSGRAIYPTADQLIATSDKLQLYNFCRAQGIATPLTFILPESKMGYPNLVKGSLRLNNSLGDTIIKPQIPVGIVRTLCSRLYENSTESWLKIKNDALKAQSSFVLQQKIEGETMKVYGVQGGDYYFVSVKSDGTESKPMKVPPSIRRLSEYVLTHFGLRWGGIDFIKNKDGVWYLIDVNPTSGGRTIPLEDKSNFDDRMKEHVKEILTKGEVKSPRTARISLTILAGGTNSRLKSIVGEVPKSLFPLADGTQMLSHLTNMINPLRQVDGFEDELMIVCRPDKTEFFSNWARLNSNSNARVIPSMIEDGDRKTSGNELLAIEPSSGVSIVASFAADRLLNIESEELKACGGKVVEYMVKQNVPYVLIGIEGESEYGYITDEDGTILSRTETEGTGFRKVGICIDTRKIPLDFAQNSKDIVAKLLGAGVHGKLIMLSKPDWIIDMDTPADYAKANRVLAK